MSLFGSVPSSNTKLCPPGVLNPKTFVSIMHANNEVGIIQDLKKIGEICLQNDAIFHSDTVQTVAHYPLDMLSLIHI